MALLINAYNGYTLQLILENYPKVKSIRDIKSPWKTARYKVGKATVSLDNIEHHLLRPIYKDPRIHFAVNCASVGCPPLLNEAFTGASLEKQLNAATKATLTSPLYIKTQGDTLKVTSILKWYGGDFTNTTYKGHTKTVAAFVAKYALPDVASMIKKQNNAPPVSYLDYDWRLNDTKTK